MNKNRILLPLAPILTLAFATSASALTKEELAGTLKGVSPDDIVESPIAGVFQVSVGPSVAYVTEDGHYLLQG
ncbi:MAG: disulfide isomerase DsbC N-terminal domain-containing protein, partial [Anaerolineae bacterium]